MGCGNIMKKTARTRKSSPDPEHNTHSADARRRHCTQHMSRVLPTSQILQQPLRKAKKYIILCLWSKPYIILNLSPYPETLRRQGPPKPSHNPGQAGRCFYVFIPYKHESSRDNPKPCKVISPKPQTSTPKP